MTKRADNAAGAALDERHRYRSSRQPDLRAGWFIFGSAWARHEDEKLSLGDVCDLRRRGDYFVVKIQGDDHYGPFGLWGMRWRQEQD